MASTSWAKELNELMTKDQPPEDWVCPKELAAAADFSTTSARNWLHRAERAGVPIKKVRRGNGLYTPYAEPKALLKFMKEKLA